MSRARLGGVALLLAVSFGSASAQAQDGKAVAVAAFDQAEKLMSEGKIAQACSKFAESQRLDPQLGTLLHLADCYSQNGQTASAWASFREAGEIAEKRGDPRQKVAEEHARALEPKLSKLQIEVPEHADAGLRIERNQVAVGDALWNTALPTDPGTYTITASAPGRSTWTGSIVVPTDGKTVVIRVPQLEAAPAGSSASGTDQPGPAQNDAPSADSKGATPWLAIGALGVGVVGVAVGSVFALTSKSKRDESESYCDGNQCTREGVDLRDDAIGAGNIATIAFIVGGAGLVGGTVLWLTHSSDSQSEKTAGFAPRVGLGLGSIRVEQSW